MRIALVTQYFWPETFSINELVQELVNQGHVVDIFTGKPNYPDGQIFEGYEAKGCIVEQYLTNATIYRVPLFPRGKKSAKGLAKNYLSFVWNGCIYFNKFASNKHYDHILTFNISPITAAIPAIYLKYKTKSPLSLWVLDLWPESLSTTGYIKNKYILRLVRYIVKLIYLNADQILVQSRAFINSIEKYVKGEKIIYFPNFSEDIGSKEITTETVIADKLISILDNYFCIVFTGNIGTAQSIETIVDTARILKNVEQVKFVVVGSGSLSSYLQKRINNDNINNIVMAGRYKSSEMPHFLNRAKALLVTLKDEEIYAKTIPAKIQTYLAAGKPILAALNGEAAKIIEEANAGYVCNAEDSESLARIVLKLYSLTNNEREKLGLNGRNYFLKNFELKKQTSYLIDILNKKL